LVQPLTINHEPFFVPNRPQSYKEKMEYASFFEENVLKVWSIQKKAVTLPPICDTNGMFFKKNH
jgi:hypothetical protein